MNVFLDFLFPKKCVSCRRFGAYLCADCTRKVEAVDKPVCPRCLRQAVGGRVHPVCKSRYGLDGLAVGVRYRGSVRMLIRKLKYRWVREMLEPLLLLLVKNISLFDLPQRMVLVPVPLHAGRKRWRGFNQAELIARDLVIRFQVPFEEILVRSRKTKTQVGLKRKERMENVRDAFVVKTGVKIKGKNFLLVDDVYTTGATMAECAKVLKRAGAGEVWAMVVALG